MKRLLSLMVVLAMVVSLAASVVAARSEIDMDELLGKLQILENFEDTIQVSLAEGEVTKVYQYTPDKTGVASLMLDWVDEEVNKFDIVISQGENSIRYSECESAFELDVVAGEKILVTVTKTSEPALEFAMYPTLKDPYGSETNPYLLLDVVTEQTTTFENAWFTGRFSGCTMVVTGEGAFNVTIDGTANAAVDGVVSLPVAAADFYAPPVLFAIDKVGSYKIEFVYPVGTYENPELLESIESIDVNIAEGNNQGYYYTWFATEAGTVQLTCPTVEGVAYAVSMTNIESFGMGWMNEEGIVTLDVAAGDEVRIQVNAEPVYDDNWNAFFPALSTVLTGEMTQSYIPGDLIGENGQVDEEDALYLLKHILLADYYPVNQNVDFDTNGEVNENDVLKLLKHILMPEMYPLFG